MGNEQASIAIIGMAARVPGARNIEDMWRNIRDGVESVTRFSYDELLSAGVPKNQLDDPNYVRAAARIDDPDLFDAPYFGYSSREAELMDPQHRIFLECSVEALERSGYDFTAYEGSVGVFAGCTSSVYHLLTQAHLQSELEADHSLHTLVTVGNAPEFLSTRTSYKLGLRGPSLTVHTACSTSLVAVHLACQSLLTSECDMALAGATALKYSYGKRGYRYSPGDILSPDGHCRPFDVRGSGTVYGDGVVVIALKRLDRALADRDVIKAVIRGTAVNNDGVDRAGFIAPGVSGQAAVIGEALAVAGVRPRDIGYVEAHGTGTPLGDSIELAALKKAFEGFDETLPSQSCYIGTVKANIGHLSVAGGIAGLVKVVLALENEAIPPQINFESPHAESPLINSPFVINTSVQSWPRSSSPRYACVSSFGVGGTNAHIVMEEAPKHAAAPSRRSVHPLLLSARSQDALETLTREVVEQSVRCPGEIPDMAQTLVKGRRVFSHRRVVIIRDGRETGRISQSGDVAKLGKDKAVFLFPGHGPQKPHVDNEIYSLESAYRAQIELCSEIVSPSLGLDLRDVLLREDRTSVDLINEPMIRQVSLFATSLATAALWRSWGVTPVSTMGYDVGEYVSAHLAGVFTLEESLETVLFRAKLMQQIRGSEVLEISSDVANVERLLPEGLTVSAVHGPLSVLASGPKSDIECLEARLTESGVAYSRRADLIAFRSPILRDAASALTRRLESIRLRRPAIPFVSNVTGNWITDAEATSAAYWGNHLMAPVRFWQGIQTIRRRAPCRFVEVGPGETLTRLCRLGEVHAMPSVRRIDGRSELEDFVDAAATLWTLGVPVDWSKYYDGEPRRSVEMPPRPFERRRYWALPPRWTSKAQPKGDAGSSNACGAKNVPLHDHSSVKETMLEIWREVLGTESVVEHEKFMEVGGDSLLAIQIIGLIARELDANVPISFFKQNPSFGDMLEYVTRGEDDSTRNPVKAY